MKPRHPIYVISKGRWENGLTAKFLLRDKVPFHLVVEPQEYDNYVANFPKENIYVLPFSNLGLGGIPARNWCWEHAKAAGYERHWILDDNIRQIKRFYKGMRINTESGPAFKCIEDFVDRYENIAIAGMNYSMFGHKGIPPFYLNCHVYSCLLILNSLPNRWRGRYNEDTDLCLQVLADGWCTVAVNAFLIEKMATMKMKGGNTDQLYKGDGRLTMANSLKRVWPYVVNVSRRFQRPQHVVKDSWRRFDTKLKLKPNVEIPSGVNNYGLVLEKVKEIESPLIEQLYEEAKAP